MRQEVRDDHIGNVTLDRASKIMIPVRIDVSVDALAPALASPAA